MKHMKHKLLRVFSGSKLIQAGFVFFWWISENSGPEKIVLYPWAVHWDAPQTTKEQLEPRQWQTNATDKKKFRKRTRLLLQSWTIAINLIHATQTMKLSKQWSETLKANLNFSKPSQFSLAQESTPSWKFRANMYLNNDNGGME